MQEISSLFNTSKAGQFSKLPDLITLERPGQFVEMFLKFLQFFRTFLFQKMLGRAIGAADTARSPSASLA